MQVCTCHGGTLACQLVPEKLKHVGWIGCMPEGTAAPYLSQHRVAAGHVVLGDLVYRGDPAEVVTHIITWLHRDDILKLDQGTLSRD